MLLYFGGFPLLQPDSNGSVAPMRSNENASIAFSTKLQPTDKLFFQAAFSNGLLTHLPWNNSMAIFAGLIWWGKPQSTETDSN